MFYDGDLQSGIALALRESKRVICFVRDDGEESNAWENDYLAEKEISELIARTSVALRLNSGTQEVGFLASFCPIAKVPTIVVINNGVLREYIVSGTDADSLKRRLRLALEDGGQPMVNSNTVNSDSSAPVQDPSQAQSEVTPIRVVEQVAPAPAAPNQSSDTPSPRPEPAQTTVEELSAERLQREEIRAGKRRVKDVDESSSSQQPAGSDQQKPKPKQQEWKETQRKRKQTEKEQKERIRALIRHDHEERKAKEQLRKQRAQAQSESQAAEDDSIETMPISQQPHTRPGNTNSDFRIQVRLLDGSSIRSTFHPLQTVRGAIRPWIDEQRADGDVPYTLKHILVPQPNRTIAVAEEDQTLHDLGLGPTASLVMVPVQTYTEAYSSAGSSLPVRGLYAGYSLVATTVGAVTGALGTFLGIGQGQQSHQEQPSSESAQASQLQDDRHRHQSSANQSSQRSNPVRGTSGSNVRTLRDTRADQGPHQFYNGNQLNFEPRKDQDKDD